MQTVASVLEAQTLQPQYDSMHIFLNWTATDNSHLTMPLNNFLNFKKCFILTADRLSITLKNGGKNEGCLTGSSFAMVTFVKKISELIHYGPYSRGGHIGYRQ